MQDKSGDEHIEQASVDEEYQDYINKNRKYKSLIIKFISLLLLVFVMDLFYLASIWPDFDSFKKGRVAKSRVIKNYELTHSDIKVMWIPLKRRIPKRIKEVFVIAEDSRFYTHSGIDYIAIRDAIRYNLTSSKRMLGASTISQQTVKNMFLSLSRNPLRKWHELLMTMAMEKSLTKDRILDIYLNIAEMGKSLYGIEAASRYYFAKASYKLTSIEAIELAATLPNPKKDNPRTRSAAFLKRKRKILRNWRFLHPKKPAIVGEKSILPRLEQLNSEHRKNQQQSFETFPKRQYGPKEKATN